MMRSLSLLLAVLLSWSSGSAPPARVAPLSPGDSLRCAEGERPVDVSALADPGRPAFADGEELHYSAYFGKLRVGSG